MIKDLNYSVTFPTNGITLKGDISFQPGTTAIVGDNGNGKTFGSIEMIRYMLFGKKALRGPATDYKTLDATMSFAIRGEDYIVERNRRAEKLTDAQGKVLAVNAEAVSQKIVQLLGFGLDVFDVVCASVQKESDKLSKMLPTARRRLIDEVIGLASNEAVEKACRDEAKALRRDADVLQDNLVPVVLPVKPDGYRVSSKVLADLEAGKAVAQKRLELQAVVNSQGEEPIHVAEPVGDLADLQARQKAHAAAKAANDHAVRELARIPEAQFSSELLDHAEALNAYNAEVARRGPKPMLTIAEAQDALEQWAHRELLEKIGTTEVECPECKHQFKPGQELPAKPDVWPAEARAALEAHQLWATPLKQPKGGVSLTAAQITGGRLALARADDRKDLLATTWLPIPEDVSVEISALARAQAQREAYLAALVRHSEATARATAAEKQLATLAFPPDLVVLNQAYVDARVYETEVANFDRGKVQYDETVTKIAEKVAKSAAFKKGAEALIKARQSVKAHLAPSLSRVSSALIYQMSGGVLSNMIVDEEMNITVDGQDIATLSGAGSTVANLALRLALGQVLVRNTFPVFIADEADADLSDSRAQFTAECLANLKDQLDQIIVITHKEVTTADHIITR